MRLILRILINVVAIWAAVWLLGGVIVQGGLFAWLFIGIVFGLVNAFIRPIVKFISLPITCVTLGLFTLVINALMLLLTSWLVNIFGGSMDLGGGFFNQIWNALLAGIIISIVSAVLSWFLPDKKKD